MKTLLFTFALLFLATSCDKKSSPNNNAAFNTNQYSMRNGSCFDNNIQTYVANQYCTNNIGAYHMSNGNCFDRDGYQVRIENCTNNGGYYGDDYGNGGNYGDDYGHGGCYGGNCGGGGYGGENCISKPCYGSYIYNQGGYMQYGKCYGVNCRGYTLIEASTGQTVRCM